MEVLVVAAHDAALLDHLRSMVHDAIEASGLPIEITMALSDTSEERLSDQQMLLWRDRRCPSGLAAFLANDPSPQPEQLLPSASVDSLASLPNNASSDSATAAAATAALLKRVHKRDRKIKTLTATVEELRAQLADALARATFVEQEQEQFFQDVQHMKEAFDKLHASHQKLLWEYLPSKDPDLRAIPRLSRELEASESRVGPYVLGDVLGYGQYATVFEAQESPEHEPLAVKAIDKEKLVDLVTLHRVNSEIAALQDPAIRHANILALRHVFHTPRYIFLITERGGKDLFEFFGPREHGVPEETVRALVRRVALAVETLHRHNYCHRDLKPENILYDPDHASAAHAVKLVDFGLCTRATSTHDAMLHDFCGSPGFFAPEILLSAQYDGQKADVWSLGCILLELVLGNDRFAAMWMTMYELETLRDHDKFRSLVHSSLEAARAYCHSAAWTYSPALRALLMSLLAENPPARPSVAQLLDHAWFHDAASPPTSVLRACSSPRGLSPTRGAKTHALPSPASFCESHLPVDAAAMAGIMRRPASAENDLSDHGSPHISVLLAAAAPAVEAPSSSSPSKTHQQAAPSDHAPAKLSLPSLSPEKPSGARSPDKTFAKRAATATSSMLPASPSHSHSHSLGAHTPPTRSSSRYDDDDAHAHS